MAMNVLHNTCNTCICDLPDMYAFSPQTAILEPRHTYQANPHAHVRTITCAPRHTSATGNIASLIDSLLLTISEHVLNDV